MLGDLANVQLVKALIFHLQIMNLKLWRNSPTPLTKTSVGNAHCGFLAIFLSWPYITAILKNHLTWDLYFVIQRWPKVKSYSPYNGASNGTNLGLTGTLLMEQPGLKNATFSTLPESYRKQSRSQNWSQIKGMDVLCNLKLAPASDEVAVASYDNFREVYFSVFT